VLALSAAAGAQTIAGTVKDDTGAVMPGVTVEASSPALIEKTRSAVSDGSGQYKIVDLRPGTYSVTQRVITRDVIDVLPTGHNIQAAAALIPGVTTSGGATSGGRDVGGNTMLQQATPIFHGSTQSMQLWDGYWLSNVQGSGTGGATSYYPDLGLYAQDRWTVKPATITAGLRYDALTEKTLDSTLPASIWNPSQSFSGRDVVHWKDVSPRVGVAFDLFGDGKTALKTNIARYVNADNANTANLNDPQRTIGISDTRTWTDVNGDHTIFNPDGSVQLNELGPSTNRNFGKIIPSTSTQDPATLNGWGVRGYTWEYQANIQRQVASRVAVDGGYMGFDLSTTARFGTGGFVQGGINAQAPRVRHL
jgi:hypothetical protein